MLNEGIQSTGTSCTFRYFVTVVSFLFCVKLLPETSWYGRTLSLYETFMKRQKQHITVSLILMLITTVQCQGFLSL